LTHEQFLKQNKIKRIKKIKNHEMTHVSYSSQSVNYFNSVRKRTKLKKNDKYYKQIEQN